MRWTPLVVLALGTSACKGKDDGGGQGTDTDTDGGPGTGWELLTEASVAEAAVEIPQDVVDAQKVLTTLLSAAALAVAEPQVQESLGATATSDEFCWIVGQPLTTYTVDYTGCAGTLGISGTVRVNESAQGPIALEWLGLTLDERTLGGVLGLDDTGAEPLHFFAYDTVAASPVPTTRSPMGVTIDGMTYSLTWDGGLALDLDANKVRLWGVGQVLDDVGATIGRIGGTDESQLTGNVAPAGAQEASLSYVDCRCPTSGESAYDVALDVVEVGVDLDALEARDDGVDDPILELGVALVVPGEVTLTTTGCGEHDVIFLTEETGLTAQVSGLEVASEIQKKCDALIIEDEAKCEALVSIAESTATFTFSIDTAILADGAAANALSRFDGGWCKF